MTAPPPPPGEVQPPRGIDLRDELRTRFDLVADRADPEIIDHSIRAGVPFRGTNLWLLIFAIIIASVGLNVNSTTAIIGAMLISPLMGPIIGVGYGAAIADFGLVRRAFANLLLAVGVSLGASAAYFLVTPLSEAHSELLAFTSPTLWDVVLALFGGLAGIVGATRREKSNVVAGVAVATALMPPLCTAGFGLAAGSFAYFARAFYFFVINSVFIATATFVMVRLMKLPEVQHVDAAASRWAHRSIAVVVVGVTLPSLYLAKRLVAEEVFAGRSTTFLSAAFPANGSTVVVGRDVDSESRHLSVTVLGEQVTPERRDALAAMLPAYGLEGATLSVAQNEQRTLDIGALREGLVRDLYQHSLADLQAKDATIEALRGELASTVAAGETLRAVEREVAVQVATATRVVATRTSEDTTPVFIVVIDTSATVAEDELERLRAWLRVRTGAPDVRAFQVVAAPKPPQPAD